MMWLRAIVRPPVHAFRRWRERRLCERALAGLRPLHETVEYRQYLVAQFLRSFSMASYVAQGRTESLMASLQACSAVPVSGAVLCLGCRNSHELELFRNAGFSDVTGVDLFSSHPDILQMDMHRLAFPDRRFDVIFACHALEHAFDPTSVIAEVGRVARPDAVCAIEVPIRFRKWPGREDLHDFESIEGLRRLCAPAMQRELCAEVIDRAPPAARLIFVVKS